MRLVKRKFGILGTMLYYDNPAAPLSLQNYPYEVKRKVLGNMHKTPKSILDIGGNLGQFSITLDHILKSNATIDTFEPNSYIFEFLKKNTKNKSNIHIYNYGLGEKEEKQLLYFDPSKTSIGSIIKQNAGLDASMEQEIDITDKPYTLTNRKKYDLVKVDVEGYEMHAIKALYGIDLEYLFIELSGQTRGKDYNHSEMMSVIKNQWGEYDIYYCGGFGSKDDIFDMLIRFKKGKPPFYYCTSL